MSIYTIAAYDVDPPHPDSYLVALAPKINHVHHGELLGVYRPGQDVTATRYGYVQGIANHDDDHWRVTLEPVPPAMQRQLTGL